jgi:hypothetical protein
MKIFLIQLSFLSRINSKKMHKIFGKEIKMN